MNPSASPPPTIRPMGWLLSLSYFCAAGVLSIVAHHFVTPMLAANGMQAFYAEFIPNTIVLASLLVAAIVAYRLEGRPLMWAALFHVWKYWDLVGLLPAHLVFVYVAARTKSTTVSIWLHIFTNTSFPVFVLLGVLGVGM